MKTFMASPATIDRKWYVVDATDMTLGRLASEVAKVLRGKNKPIFTPHIDCGDNVIVINAEKIKVTGKKMDQKVYYHHSDYVGGLKEATLREKLEKKLYEITPDGKEDFLQWLALDPPLDPTPKDAFRLRTYYFQWLPKETYLDLLEQQIIKHTQKLDFLLDQKNENYKTHLIT